MGAFPQLRCTHTVTALRAWVGRESWAFVRSEAKRDDRGIVSGQGPAEKHPIFLSRRAANWFGGRRLPVPQGGFPAQYRSRSISVKVGESYFQIVFFFYAPPILLEQKCIHSRLTALAVARPSRNCGYVFWDVSTEFA